MSNRYEHLHYCEYRDTETGLIAGNYVDVMNEQDQKIKDLEAKLAESKEMLKNTHKALERRNKERQEYISKYRYWKGECYELKQQLAEKNQAIESLQEINQSLGQTCNNDAKEIERLNNLLKEEKTRNKKLNHEAQKYYEDAYCNNFQNQTAIAELEKVKNIIDSKVKNIDKRLDDLNIKIVCESTSMQLSTYKEVVKLIDQQIKSLKGE